MHPGSELTVREFIYESDLDLRLLTGDIGIERQITAIHISDIPDPVPWLVRGTVLLTTGAQFADDVGVGLRLLERLVGIDASALGVGPGEFLDRVPSEMIEGAVRLGLPLFTTPRDMPFRVIMSYVNNSLASGDLHRLRRTVAVQNRLLDLLVADNEVVRLVENVAQLLEMPVLLFDGDGRLLAAAGRGDTAVVASELWRAYTARHPAAGPFGMVEAGRARYYFRDVIEFGRVQRVVAAAAAEAATTEYVDTSLSFLQRLVALDLLRSRNELEASRRRRALLLDDLLAGGEPAGQLGERLASQGFGAAGSRRVLVCRVASAPARAAAEDQEARELLVEIVDEALARLHVPFLSTMRGDAVAVLVSLPGPEPQDALDLLREIHAAVAAAIAPATPALGCSAPVDGVGAMPRGLQEAREACTAAEQGAGTSGWVLFETMRGRFRLLEGQSPAALADLVRRTITPLLEWDARHKTSLVTTLRAYVEHSFSAQDAAASLFVHRNTLQRRLSRIEELLGVDFDRVDDVLELYLGVCAAELLGEPGLGRPPTAR